MDLQDCLNQYYYTLTVSDLRQIHRSGGGNLSYNSIMYLDVISYQQSQGGCTVSSLASTLRVSKAAVTLKINDLEKLGLVVRSRDGADRRVVHLRVSEAVADALRVYDRPLERAVRLVQEQFSDAEIGTFCRILQVFSAEFEKEEPSQPGGSA